MKEKQTPEKRPYNKPELRIINLVPGEVLAGTCKQFDPIVDPCSGVVDLGS